MTARARACADIRMPGFVAGRETLACLLASCDVLLHSCPFETFGLSLAEAMSCGLPLVVPDEGGASEMHDPASGERYRALDVEACVRAIERLLERLSTDRAGLRAASAAAVSRLPTVVQQFEGQISLYRELLNRRQQL